MISKTEIKQLSRLSTKKGRNEYGLYLIEGLRIIRSALRAKVPINRVFVTARFEKSVDYQSISNRFNKVLKPEFIDEKTMKQITQTMSPSGILAVCSIPKITELPSTMTSNWLYLDKIADPGNLGTLLRSAAWFGTTQVALSLHCTDPFNPKVIRSGMGAPMHRAAVRGGCARGVGRGGRLPRPGPDPVHPRVFIRIVII